jgi:D-glycero-alpha-D-manno-heptose 1-phosphate guanylyltransferase
MTEAIILAGGKGTRLQGVIADVPKPMADIQGRPFLEYLLDSLIANKITTVILSVGYKHDVIINHFGDTYRNLKLDYSIELQPLGTGGAIIKAAERITTKQFFILNGDSYFGVSLQAMSREHIFKKSDFTLAAKYINDSSRYGLLEVENSKVIKFKEKQAKSSGLINAGVYLMNKSLITLLPFEKSFSFEKSCLEDPTRAFDISYFTSDGYFIDIGVPEDYLKAQEELIKVIE